MPISRDEMLSLRPMWSTWGQIAKPFERWLVGTGAASSKSPAPDSTHSVIFYCHGYTSAIKWAERIGLDVSSTAPVELWTPELIRQMSEELFTKRMSPLTARMQIIAIDRILAATSPQTSRRFVQRILKPIPRQADARNKKSKLQDSGELLAFGVELMERAIAEPEPSKSTALTFRRGLQVAVLAGRPFRLATFSSFVVAPGGQSGIMRKDAYIVAAGDGFAMVCNAPKRRVAGNVKAARNYNRASRPLKGGKHAPPVQSVPDELVKYMRLWLDVFRPQLLKPDVPCDALWVNQNGGAESKMMIYKDIRELTGLKFDKSLSPKLFRDSLATSIVGLDPSAKLSVNLLLGNTQQITDGSYIHRNSATSIKVGRMAADILDGPLLFGR